MIHRRRTTLSPSEREVLALLGDGKTTGEIAEQKGRSIKTIQTWCASIKHKLGAENNNQLIQKAVLSRDPGVSKALAILLDRTEIIEIRFMDEHGKLIQTRRFRP